MLTTRVKKDKFSEDARSLANKHTYQELFYMYSKHKQGEYSGISPYCWEAMEYKKALSATLGNIEYFSTHIREFGFNPEGAK